MKKSLSAVLAIIMAVSVLTVAAGADSIEKTARKTLEIGKSYTLTIPTYDAKDCLDVKIVMPKTGNLTLTYTHYAAYMGWNLFDTNGQTKKSSKNNTSAGEAGWGDGWYSTYGSGSFNHVLSDGTFVAKWNSVSEKASGDVTYKLDKGTYYLRITRTKEGASDLKLKLTAKDLDGKTIGASSSGSKAAKSVDITVSLKAGETLQLGSAVNPSDSTSAVSWTSDKTSVATVSASGKITAVAKGSAVITCKAGSVSTKIKVNVT